MTVLQKAPMTAPVVTGSRITDPAWLEWFDRLVARINSLVAQGAIAPSLAVRSTSTSTSLLDTDYLLIVSGGPTVVQLPQASTHAGWEFNVKSVTAGLVSLAAAGGDTIDGDVSISLFEDECATAISDGVSAWRIV